MNRNIISIPNLKMGNWIQRLNDLSKFSDPPHGRIEFKPKKVNSSFKIHIAFKNSLLNTNFFNGLTSTLKLNMISR